jgi:hypothetical protein
LFDGTTQSCLQVIDIPAEIFKDMTYSLEIYQDGATTVQMGWQGLMSGHYDMPTHNVKDITPIFGCLWYQSAAQAKQKQVVDLPGTVWVVSVSENIEILGMATPGLAVQFQILRPEVGTKKQIYFVYVDSTDSTKAQQFVQKFASKTIGANLIASYQKNADEIMSSEGARLQPQLAAAKTTPKTVSVPAALMQQAVQGSLQMQQGRIVDLTTGVTGYLLGADVFLPFGIGATSMYYMLAPSYQNEQNLPTSAVSNLYAQDFITTAPEGMPTPTASL